jgi:integrase
MKERKRRRTRGSGALYQRHKPGCQRKRCECPWWISYRGLDGRRYAESAGTSKKTEAEAALRAKVGDLDRGTPVTPDVGKLTVREAIDAVLADYRNTGKKSIDEAKRRLERVARFFGPMTRMAGITPTHLQKFVTWRQEVGIVPISGPRKGQRVKDVSGADINRDLRLLGRAFNLAIEQERLLRGPKFPTLGESQPRSGFFEADQLASVLRQLPAHLQPVVTFGALTGWRKSEVAALEWRNITADEIRIDDSKNGEGRVFPMTNDLRRIIEARKVERDRVQAKGEITPLVFFRVLKNGKVKPVGDYKKSWRTARTAAGLPGKLVHDLRRTAVRGFSGAGLPDQVSMALTGHKTRSVFDRYRIVSASDRDIVRRLLDTPAVGMGT